MDRNRSELMRTMLEIFDTIDNLRYDNLRLRERVRAYEAGGTDEVKKLTDMDERVLAFGREQLVDKALGYWKGVKYDEDEETGDVTVEPYEKWCKHVVRRDAIPSWCSLDGFWDYFAVELREVYDAECEKAVAEAHNER